MDFFARIAEDRIKEAITRGEFDDLPGKGKPLELEDMSSIPEELRAGYKILKNAGMIPVEMQLSKDMVTLQELIAICKNDNEQKLLRKQLTEKQVQFQLLLESRGLGHSMAFTQYEQQIRAKIEGDG